MLSVITNVHDVKMYCESQLKITM